MAPSADGYAEMGRLPAPIMAEEPSLGGGKSPAMVLLGVVALPCVPPATAVVLSPRDLFYRFRLVLAYGAAAPLAESAPTSDLPPALTWSPEAFMRCLLSS